MKENEEFNDSLSMAMSEASGDTAFSMDKDRPYNGQPHTGPGRRGSEVVKGLTMRDIADCMVKGLLSAGGIYRDTPVWDDVYKVPNDIDLIAAVQNAGCEIEKMMGIYPNVPELE